METACKNIQQLSFGEILMNFQNFMNNFDVSNIEQDLIDNHINFYKDSNELFSELINKLSQISLIKFKNEVISIYITLLFINKSKKDLTDPIHTYMQSIIYEEEERTLILKQDQDVEKANSKRGLLFGKFEETDYSFNSTTNIYAK
jgi:hypothetical protein